MFDLDEFTKAVFEDIRDGVPIVSSENSSSMYYDDPFHDANELASQYSFRRSSLPSSVSSAVIPETMFVLEELLGLNEGPSWDAVASQSLPRRPYYSRRSSLYVPLVANSDPWTVDNKLVPPPTIACNKRRIEDDSPDWHVYKYARVDGPNTVEKIHPSAYPQAGFMGFPSTHEYTEGNALRFNNYTTRTSNCEEIFPAVGSVPVAVQSSAQGLWPLMTSSTAPQRRPAQTPFMAAGYSSPLFPVSFGSLPSSAAPASFTQFNPVPDTTTEYGLDLLSQPSFLGGPFNLGPSQALSWATIQQALRYPAQSHLDEPSFQTVGPPSFPNSVLPWPFRAAGKNDFPSGPTPSLSTGYGVDPSFASVAEQPSNQDLLVPVQAPQTSATLPQPLPDPVAESSFGVASQGSSSSSSAPKPSNADPQKKGKKKAQTPFLLAEDKCHLCNEGFKRGSELHHHWTTNKHRLREREAENPGVIVTVDDLTPNCFCPSCGKGYTTPYVVKRHLKKCAGQEGSSQSGSQDGEGRR